MLSLSKTNQSESVLVPAEAYYKMTADIEKKEFLQKELDAALARKLELENQQKYFWPVAGLLTGLLAGVLIGVNNTK